MYIEIENYIIECVEGNSRFSSKKMDRLKSKFNVEHVSLTEFYSRALKKEIPLCQECETEQVYLISFSKGYRKYCSKDCYKKSMSKRNSLKNKNLNKKKSEKLDQQYSEMLKLASDEYVSNECLTIRDISIKYNIPLGRVRKYLSDNNLTDNERRHKIFRSNINDRMGDILQRLLDKEWVLNKIEEENWTSKEFAVELGCSKNYVCERLRDTGIFLSDYSKNKSSYERIIREYLDQLQIEYICNDRKILNGKELDIFIPNHNLAIEINGVYWHRDIDGSKKNYHKIKTDICESNNIRLLHITDKEIDFKFDMVKNLISSALGLNKRIYARKCIVDNIDSKTFANFMYSNHFQGSINSSIRYGLFCRGDLVSVMGFSKPRFSSKQDYELTRFCNKIGYNVVGGASKLFKRFCIDNKNKTVVSYCDRKFFTGTMYERIGMDLSHLSPPNYVWIHNNTGDVLTRYQTQKHKLENCPENYTEHMYMTDKNYFKLYDSGQKVYTFGEEMFY